MKTRKFLIIFFLSVLCLSKPTFAEEIKAQTLNSVEYKIPISNVYKEGIYRFDITCTHCTANVRLLSNDKPAVILIINEDHTERLFQKCSDSSITLNVGKLTNKDTVVIVGEGEFFINFIK